MVVAASRLLLSGNEAVARAAREARVDLATGYPGTPSTEILETLSHLGGQAQWAPNEKVAVEVAVGASLGCGRAMAVMKHVGLNVAADPFFASAYVEIPGALVIISADDPGMFSSQNEQDNRRFAHAAAVPMLEPSDSQECYDMTLAAFEISHRWGIPVLLRLTTRVCHSKAVVRPEPSGFKSLSTCFERDVEGRVLLPAYSRPAHRRLRAKLEEMRAWSETSELNVEIRQSSEIGIITSGVSFLHAHEASSEASILKLGMTSPLPLDSIRAFADSVETCIVVEEGDPYLFELIRAAGVEVEGKTEDFRYGELSVDRARRVLQRVADVEPDTPTGTAPQLCPACAYRDVFSILSELGCIVAGDIGCYTLGALEPFEAIDSTLCMGASIGMGLGLRHVLPKEQARKVVSVIGDSTFVHSGVTALIEMMYNQPPTGHIVLILDNETTAMTGQQEHPGTGVTLKEQRTVRLDFEALVRAIGVKNVETHDVKKDPLRFRAALERYFDQDEPTVLIARRPCVLKQRRRPEFRESES